MYIIANNLYTEDNKILIDETINKYFMIDVPPLHLKKATFYSTLLAIVDNISLFFKPVDKIELNHIINLKLPPYKNYINNDPKFVKEVNYMKIVNRKISSQ